MLWWHKEINQLKKCTTQYYHVYGHFSDELILSRICSISDSEHCFQATSHYYVSVAYCYRLSGVDCLSVTSVSPAKMAEPIEISFWMLNLCGPKQPCIRWLHIPPMQKDSLEGEGAAHCKV